MWRIRLHDQDVERCAEVTTQRQLKKARNNVKTQKYDINRTDWDIQYLGTLGEIGAARALCADVDWSVLAGGDQGYDIKIGPTTFQVKTPLSKATRNKFYLNDEERFSADYGILCNVDEPEVIVRGWIDRATFVRISRLANFGYGERMFVDADEMLSMDQVIVARQKLYDVQIGEAC